VQNKNALLARLLWLVLLCAFSGLAAAQATRVNAGGSTYTDTASNVWSADSGFNTGTVSNWGAVSITGTSDPTLYRTERWDPPAAPEMTYTFNVANGTYTVRLHFAENWSPAFAVGVRVFDVTIQGSLVFDNLDVFAQAGARTALIKTATATVTSGTLTIGFVHQVDDPFIDAIELIPSTDTTPPSVPGSLTATAVGSAQINLSWAAATDNVGVTAYLIERCQGAGCSNFAQITSATSITYSDGGLASQSAYSYRVRARDAANNLGGYSNTASATTLQAGGPASSSYTYDELGRLRTGTFPGNLRVDYQYDPAGNRTEMNSGTPVTLVIGTSTSVTEGGTLSFPVTRTGTTQGNVTVNCSSQNGTAQGGGAAPFDDYTPIVNQQLTFLASDPSPTTKNCTIVTKADSYYEGTQTVVATLQNAAGGAVIVTGSATGSILDPSAGPVFSISGSSVAEGSALSFTISKSGLTEHSHNVGYSTADGTATIADGDYTAIAATTVTFASTQTSQPISVTTASDTRYENSETLALSLSSPTNGATLGTSSANGTINNDDAAPSIRVVGGALVNEGNPATLTVQNIGNTNTAFTHSISWATANDTATAGLDYVAASGTVSFSAGETSKPVQVQTLTDGQNDGNGTHETFFVNISTNASSNGAVITVSQAQGGIADLNTDIPTWPVMQSPAFRQDNDGNFGIDWSDSLGPLSYYILQESSSSDFTSPGNYNTGTTSFRSFNYPGGAGDYFYRVKACTSSNVCTTWSSTAQVLNCSPECP
jgi:hypothetical protein